MQHEEAHPLARFGYCKPSFRLWRFSPTLWCWMANLRDIRLVLSGKLNLHIAWQAGYDDGRKGEYERVVINGGSLVPHLSALKKAADCIWGLDGGEFFAATGWKSEDSLAVWKEINAVLERYNKGEVR